MHSVRYPSFIIGSHHAEQFIRHPRDFNVSTHHYRLDPYLRKRTESSLLVSSKPWLGSDRSTCPSHPSTRASDDRHANMNSLKGKNPRNTGSNSRDKLQLPPAPSAGMTQENQGTWDRSVPHVPNIWWRTTVAEEWCLHIQPFRLPTYYCRV